MMIPVYRENITDYMEPSKDGPVTRQQVEFTFGVMGETDADGRGVFYRDTLRESWADRTPKERQAEAEARYDRWWDATTQPVQPAVPSAQQLADEVANAEQALRDAQRNLLDARDRQAEALAAIPMATAVQNGSWTDPATWQDGVIPDAGSKFVILADVTVSEIPVDVEITGTVRAVEEPTPDKG